MPLDRNSPLYLDVTEDLKRVDGVMTKLVGDRDLWQEFLADPNGVLIRLGLHPDTSSEINSRVNKIFWATITDKELIGTISRHYQSFKPERLKDLQTYFLSGLSESCVRHDVDYDLQALNHLIDDEEALSAILTRSLVVINDAFLSNERYSDEDIRGYVTALSKAIQSGVPLRDFPKLETWDEFYGIGMPFGAAVGEVGPAVTALAAVEVASVVTVFLDFGFWGVALEQSTRAAMEGDPAAIQRLAIAGRALDLGAELLATAHHFHRRMYH